MENRVHVKIARRFDNRDEGLSDDSARAIELHKRRAVALHDIFDSEPAVVVHCWGDTDDEEAHEDIEIILEFLQWASEPQQFQAVSDAALAVGKLLGAALVGGLVSEGVKWLFGRLRQKQEEGMITNTNITVSPNINVYVVAPQNGGQVHLSFELKDGLGNLDKND